MRPAVTSPASTIALMSTKSRGAPRATSTTIFEATLSSSVSIGKRPHGLGTGGSISTERTETWNEKALFAPSPASSEIVSPHARSRAEYPNSVAVWKKASRAAASARGSSRESYQATTSPVWR